jgi:hypothetical protein
MDSTPPGRGSAVDDLPLDEGEEEHAARARPRASQTTRKAKVKKVRKPSAGIEMREVSGRKLAVIGVVVVVLVVVAAGFLRGGSAKEARFALGPVKIAKTNIKTFDEPEFAIKFRYPQGFNSVDVRIGSSAGARPAAQKAIGLKGDNVVIVTRYNLQRRVTEDNLDTIKPEADKLFSRLAGKDLKAKSTTVAGMPALEYEAFDLQRPKNARSKLLVLFDGVTEYLINCQSMPDQRKQLEKGCDVVRGSISHV